MKKILFILLLLCTEVYAAAPDRPTGSIASPGTVISSTAYNNDLNTIYTYLQNGVDTYASQSINNGHIATSAAIAYSKLNLTGGIVNADVSTSAAISYNKVNLFSAVKNTDLSGGINDNKLNQITTAGKVSGSSLTSLSSIVTGAGFIPTANLGSGTASSSNFLRGDQSWSAPGVGWTLAKTGTFSSSASVSLSSLTMATGETYMLVVTGHTGASVSLALTVNNDTSGGDYNYIKTGTTFSAGTPTVVNSRATGQDNFDISDVAYSSGASNSFIFRGFINVETASNFMIHMILTGQDNNFSTSESLGTIGNYVGGSSPFTSLEFKDTGAASTLTGTYYLYKLTSS